jgi:hypothetical protein
MNRFLVISVLLVAGCSPRPIPPGRQFARTIIHVLDWHLVERDAFAADLRSQDSTITSEEIERQYQEHLDDVERVQSEQRDLLLTLLDQHQIVTVFLEGLTDEGRDDIEAIIATAKANGERLDKVKENAALLDDPARQELDSLVSQHRIELLRIGAAGQLYMEGKVQHLRGAESKESFARANPVTENGVIIDPDAMAEREEDIVFNLSMNTAPVVIVVLGSAHDLTADTARYVTPKLKYVRIGTPSLPTLHTPAPRP